MWRLFRAGEIIYAWRYGEGDASSFVFLEYKTGGCMKCKMRVKMKIGCWSYVPALRVQIFISSSGQWGGCYWTSWIQENDNVIVAFPSFLGTVSDKDRSQNNANHTQSCPFPTGINRGPSSRYLHSLIPQTEFLFPPGILWEAAVGGWLKPHGTVPFLLLPENLLGPFEKNFGSRERLADSILSWGHILIGMISWVARNQSTQSNLINKNKHLKYII